MNRSVLDMIADAMASADGPDKARLCVGLAAARAELVVLRGDPRGYGQGFYDPFGPVIHHIDALLSDKPVA